MNVKIKLLYLVLLFAPLLTLQAQEKRYDIYAVGFYNLENLFDTIHQQGKNDYEFLPDGVNKWSTKKYSNKIKNIAKVLDDMASSVPSSGLAAVLMALTITVAAAVPSRFMAVPTSVWSALKLTAATASSRE